LRFTAATISTPMKNPIRTAHGQFLLGHVGWVAVETAI
jgi:hypothetical protein